MVTHIHRLLALVFLLASLLGNAQSQAEKTLLKTASKQFEAQEFLAALPSYSQLLSIAPENKEYNFKYGACLLASDEDVERSIKHLKYVCTDGDFEDERAYYFLGKAYHLNYQFSAALRLYEEFKSKADSKTLDKHREVDRLMTMAANGKELMSDIKDIRVIDKTESTTSDFFRNYDMAVMGGSVIKVPTQLLSSTDKKKAHSPVMFFPEGGGEIIFSSYGSGDHLDLYSVERTGNSDFTKPKKLEGVVNSPFDENYPFLHSDGRTLYFSSKGHNSMGGYDVFKSKRDLSTGVFETPVNLDFAISSPDDDIFYMVDRDKRIANFASDRNSESGRLHVYKVAVSNAILELAIVEGKLINTTGGNSIAQIRVLDANTDEEVGVYRTDEEGNYIIELPGSGKYKFFVEAEDSQVLHTGLVDVPAFGQIMAFKQEMILSLESSQEKLVIKNQFDEKADLDVLTLIQDVVKQKAQLDVNFDGDPEALVEEEAVPTLTESELVSRAGFGEDVSLASIVELADNQSTSISSLVEAEEVERDKAFALAIEWTQRSETLMQEAQQLYQSAQSATSSLEKEDLILLTSLKRIEAEKAANEAAIALVLAEEVDEVIRRKNVVVQSLEERNTFLSESVQSNNQATIIARIEEVKSYDDRSEIQADALDAINERSIESNREARKVIDRVEEIRNTRTSGVNDITTKETQLERAKKQKDKDILSAELSSLRAELADTDLQLERAAARLQTSQTEADNASGAVKLLEQMRVGQMGELVELVPLPIPQDGLADTDRRLTAVYNKSTEIEVSKEELGRIMASRPELVDNLSPSERDLLRKFSSGTQSGLTDVVAIGGESPSAVQGSEIADVNGEIDSSDNAIALEDLAEEEVQNRSNSETDAQSDLDQALGSDNSIEEIEQKDINEPEITDNDSSSVSVAADTLSEEIQTPQESELEDYSSMTTTELLSHLQSDYESALRDIEKSDMVEIEKSRANIDLNRAAVQVIDEKIGEIEASENFAASEVKQGNVNAMNMLANELEADMLVIAAMTETPIYPNDENNPIADLEQRADAVNESIETDISGLSQGSAEEDVIVIPADQKAASLAAQLQKADLLVSMEAEIELISEDAEMTRMIKSAARIKSRTDFIEDLKKSVVENKTLDQDEKENLTALIKIQQKNLETDIQIWQVETGTILTPAEMVMAKNTTDYISQRTLLETSIDTQPIEALDYEVARRIMDDLNGLMILGVDFTSKEEQRILQEFIATSTPAAEVLSRSYESVYAEIAPLAEDRAWIAKLISDRDLQQQVMAIREEMALLLVYGDSEEEKFRKHIALNQDLAAPLRDEILWKEEELKVATKKNDVTLDVFNLTRESYALNSRAKEIRKTAKLNTSLIENAEMLSKATLLNLSAIEKLEEAYQLQKHLNKGKDRDEFEYRDAVVIDSGLLMNETETFALGSTTPENHVDSSLVTTETELDTSFETDSQSKDQIKSASEESGQVTEDGTIDTSFGVEESEFDPLVVESQEVALITDVAQLDELDRIEATEAIRDYPETTAQLSEHDILPILSFEEVTSLMSDEESVVVYDGDWEISGAAPEQLNQLESKGVAMEKHIHYQAELQDKVDRYSNERQKRTVRLAEVIDQITESDNDPALTQEAKRLTREIQIIDGYSRQANININSTGNTIAALENERDDILREIEETVILQVEDESYPDDNPVIDEAIVAVSDGVIEQEKVAIVDSTTPALPEEVSLITPDAKIVAPDLTPVAEPDYEAFVMPEVLNSDMFRVSAPDAARTRSIPVDVIMPSGTVYQVQVGAFRNPIPVAHFSEFDPIMGTRLDNGITRYKVGLFQDESTAIVARNQIRGLGYSDAFVVKYTDGSREGIVNDASLIVSSSSTDSSVPSSSESGSESDIETDKGEIAGTETSSSTRVSERASSDIPRAIDPNGARSARPLSEYDSDNTAYYEEAINAAPATQVERIEGLFYTVQVGVYSKPVTLASIYGITPLNTDLTNSGKIRYTSGIFDDAAVATQWKQKIIERGVSDAFVTAYHNGNRITLARANILVSSQGETVLVAIDKLNSLDADRQGQAIWEMVSTSDLFSDKVAEQIDFKIRMGPYYERIPDKDVKVILDFENNVDYRQLSDGAIIYTTKGRMTYDQAQEWRVRFLELGISNANIIALKEGVEIPVKQALEFLLK